MRNGAEEKLGESSTSYGSSNSEDGILGYGSWNIQDATICDVGVGSFGRGFRMRLSIIS
jgi:hypothetical protein